MASLTPAAELVALTCTDEVPNLKLAGFSTAPHRAAARVLRKEQAFMKWQLNPQVVSRRLGSSSVLVNLDSNAIYELNSTGARVVDLLASGIDDLALPNQLRSEFDDVSDSVQSDVRRLLQDLQTAGLILPVHG